MSAACACPARWPDWDGQDVNLGGEVVHTLPFPSFLHMPIGYEIYVTRQQDEIRRLELEERWPGLVLTRSGAFGGKIIRVLTGGDSPSRRVGRLPNPYRLHVALHRGDVGTLRRTVQPMQARLLDAGRMPRELYLCYLTCPLCSARKGGDRILVLRHWVTSDRLGKRIGRR